MQIVTNSKQAKIFIENCFSTLDTTPMSNSTSFWPFDNNTLDILLSFDGIAINNPSYKTPGINGYGSALYINRSQNQFVEVSTYRNLTYRSFTVEMWFYWISLTTADYGFFGQYHAQTADQSLHCMIRNEKLFLGFFSDDLSGSTNIQINTWYHVAFVYDYSSSTQKIYLNGILDSSRSSSPYQGTSGSIAIGKTEQIPGTPNYFFG
jgi:hypothetical protein